MTFINLIFIWFIYAFIGWIMETLYVSIPAGHFVERGFLKGPIIPIYAFGAYLVLYLLAPFGKHPLYLFVFGFIATSALEYITSYILEKLFHMSWWDYSSKKYNLNGRVCLKNSTLFGLLSLILVLWVHPVITSFAMNIPATSRTALTLVFLMISLIDFATTLASMLKLRARLKTMRNQLETHAFERLKKGEARLLRIFPNLKSIDLKLRADEILAIIRNQFK